MPRVTIPQARYWLLTIPVEHLPNEPELSETLSISRANKNEERKQDFCIGNSLLFSQRNLDSEESSLTSVHKPIVNPLAASQRTTTSGRKIHVCLTHSLSMVPCPFQEPALPIGTESTMMPSSETSRISPRTSSLEITRLSSASGSTTLSLLSDLTLPSISTGATLGLANLDAPGMRQDQSMMSSSRTLTLSGGMATEDNRPSLLMSLLVVSILVTFLSGLIVT